MSLPAQNVAPQVVAAPGQTIFPFAWRCDDSLLVTVWVNDVLDGGFSVARNADQTASPGGTITRAVACLGGEVVTVERLSPQSQTTAFIKYGPFPADSVTTMVDKFVMLSQEAASILGKVVKAARSNLSKFSSLELPAPSDGQALTYIADPLAAGKFKFSLGTFITQVALEAYVQAAISGGSVFFPLSWTFIAADDVTTDFTLTGATLNAPELYFVMVGGVVQEPVEAYTIDGVTHKIKFAAPVPVNSRVYVQALGYAKGAPVTDTMSADRGDANVALTPGTDYVLQRFATALTANRTVTLAAGRVNGDHFRITRTGLGAFTLNINGGLKILPSATAAFADVMWDGSAWRLTAYGTL